MPRSSWYSVSFLQRSQYRLDAIFSLHIQRVCNRPQPRTLGTNPGRTFRRLIGIAPILGAPALRQSPHFDSCGERGLSANATLWEPSRIFPRSVCAADRAVNFTAVVQFFVIWCTRFALVGAPVRVHLFATIVRLAIGRTRRFSYAKNAAALATPTRDGRPFDRAYALTIRSYPPLVAPHRIVT